MSLFDLNQDASEPESHPDYVRILDSHVGKGVYAVRPYPVAAVIGEIKGKLIDDPSYGTEYTFEATDGLLLEPIAPFRFINHSCDPNCEFDWMTESGSEAETDAIGSSRPGGLYLAALRNIQPDEQLTIDYNWSAAAAIRCQCRSSVCRGWVVAVDELAAARMPKQLSFDW